MGTAHFKLNFSSVQFSFSCVKPVLWSLQADFDSTKNVQRFQSLEFASEEINLCLLRRERYCELGAPFWRHSYIGEHIVFFWHMINMRPIFWTQWCKYEVVVLSWKFFPFSIHMKQQQGKELE